MNKLTSLMAASILSIGISSSGLADQVTLKFHTMVPMPANSNAKFVKPWADKVKKESVTPLVPTPIVTLDSGHATLSEKGDYAFASIVKGTFQR